MTILPKLRCKYGEPVGIELFFQFPDIASNEKTYLDADAASGSGSITANGTNFAVGTYVIIGNPGNEHTEIIKIHASTTPTATTITFATNTVFAHSRGDLVRFIPYNQIVPERSTDSGSNFSALSAISIRPDATETYLQRSSDASTDVYRFRFYNSADAIYSAYSDNATASGYADNTIHSIKRRALLDLGEQLGGIGGNLTDEWLNGALFEGRRELDQDPRVLRWAFRTKMNTDIGDMIPGRWTIAAPTDLRDRNSYKNILAIRVGRQNYPLRYQDLQAFNRNYENIAHSTLNGAITSASTSIVLTSSGDFDESGTIYIAGEDISDTNDAVTYTANTESTATLSGASGVAAGGHATGRDVWQGVNFGIPSAYTIDNATIKFDIPFSDSVAGENIYMDYYQSLQASDSDSDTLDEPDYDMFVSWLKWKIKYLKAGGAIKAEDDTDYKEWKTRKDALVAKEITGQFGYLIPTTSDDLEG